ncbi:MAG: hypothetical protein IJ639_01440 [Ruminococcus sp.]|nr:hypothetical protein [Ruminococcus sp.]
MQDMIRRIVEADNEAKALEEENLRATEEEKQRIEEEAAAIYKEYMDNAQEEIRKNDEHLQRKYARKLSDATAKQESVLIKLKADYDQNCDKWVDEIVERVIG